VWKAEDTGGETEIKETRNGTEGRRYRGKTKIEKTRKGMEGRRYRRRD
jgi:hypothetical protein